MSVLDIIFVIAVIVVVVLIILGMMALNNLIFPRQPRNDGNGIYEGYDLK
ncbi:hypothetical protein [Herbiconiux liukaitaii]